MNQKRPISRVVLDALLTTAILAAVTALGAVMTRFADGGGGYVGYLFVLAVVFISRATEGYFWGIFASLFSAVCVNLVFTPPCWRLDLTNGGSLLAFIMLLAASLTISATTTLLKSHDRERRDAERESMRADLLRAMSHDIRTPLTSIVGNTAAMLEDNGSLSPEQKRRLLHDVNEDAQWLIRMVENILSITRIHGGTGELATEYEAVEEVIDAAARKFAKRFPQTSVMLAAPDEVLLVPMDVTLIQQVILNLMENAVIHGAAEHIRLTVWREGSNALFTVRDDGTGLDKKRFATLFDAAPFGLHDGDKKKNMGIGLSVCRTIIKAHGGTITAENLPRRGACFRFTLPLKEDMLHETEG